MIRRPCLTSTAMTAIVAMTTTIFVASTISASPAIEYERASKLIHLPYPLTITPDGVLKPEGSKWTMEKETDGTELFTAKNADARVAAMKSPEGLESFTYYSLQSPQKNEISSSIFFAKGKIAAVTSCEFESSKSTVGRVCVTATPKLCQTLKKQEPLGPDTIKEMDLFEMRALATILTLRGPDHQLDNVVKTGNRLGLKSSLQTTKGQLVALSRQIAKETATQTTTGTKKEAMPTTTQGVPRSPSSPPSPSSPASPTVMSATAALNTAKEDDAEVRATLEKSLPRLRQACNDTGFVN